MLYCEVFFILYHSKYEVTLCIMKICNIMYTRKLVWLSVRRVVTHMEEKCEHSIGLSLVAFFTFRC